ncbi:MAG: hypothetical protein AAB590_02885, partial [Patescibacteria group bacterium]
MYKQFNLGRTTVGKITHLALVLSMALWSVGASFWAAEFASAYTWPTFTTITNDPSGDAPSCENRDFTTVSYAQDSGYWYFKIDVIGDPVFATSGGCKGTIFKIALDSDGDGVVTTSQVQNYEYILALADVLPSTTHGSPQLYLVPSPDNTLTDSHETSEGYFEVIDSSVYMAISKTEVSSLSQIFVYTDSSKNNLKQHSSGGNVDRLDSGGVPVIVPIPPMLTLNKVVVNDNSGSASVTAWTLNASGPTSISGAGTVSSNGTFEAGTYTLSETGGPTGYTASDWSCVKNGGSAVLGDSITLANGDTATCTITNDDNAPAKATLTLVKAITNDNNGTSVVADWTLSASGPTALTGTTGDSAVTNVEVDPGSYNLSENGLVGYTASDWVCTGTGEQVDSDTVTLDVGETAICTITNNDKAENTLDMCKDTLDNDEDGNVDLDDSECVSFFPQLLITKVAVTDNHVSGKVAGDFTINVDATNPSSSTFAGSAVGITITLDPGNYSVDEVVDSAYAKTLGAECS